MKNFITTNHTYDDEQTDVCNTEGRCVQIKKTRNLIIWLGVGMIALSYLLLVPGANQIKLLHSQVTPSVSLYSNPLSLEDKFPLLNDDNNATTLDELANNKWTILYFGYTSCPDVYPKGLNILNQTLNMMQSADRLNVVFISVDPENDIGNLSNFAKGFNPDFIGLSAKESVLTDMSKRLGLYREISKIKQRSQSQEAPIERANSYLLLSPELELTGLLEAPHDAVKMAKSLDLIIQTLD